MKKKLTLLLLLVSIITYSQEKEKRFNLEKGTWVLEGDIKMNSTKNAHDSNTTESKTFAFGIAPKVGYTINNNLVLGLGLGYNFSRNKFHSNFQNKVSVDNIYSISPYIKKFFPLTSRLAFNIEGFTRFYFSDMEVEDSLNPTTNRYKNIGIAAGLRPGINYGLSENVLLELNFGSLGYNQQTTEIDGVRTWNFSTFGFDVDSSSLVLGISIVL